MKCWCSNQAGMDKSSVLRALPGRQWFSDDLPLGVVQNRSSNARLANGSSRHQNCKAIRMPRWTISKARYHGKSMGGAPRLWSPIR